MNSCWAMSIIVCALVVMLYKDKHMEVGAEESCSLALASAHVRLPPNSEHSLA